MLPFTDSKEDRLFDTQEQHR